MPSARFHYEFRTTIKPCESCGNPVMKNNLGQLEFIELCRKIGGYSHS